MTNINELLRMYREKFNEPWPVTSILPDKELRAAILACLESGKTYLADVYDPDIIY